MGSNEEDGVYKHNTDKLVTSTLAVQQAYRVYSAPTAVIRVYLVI